MTLKRLLLGLALILFLIALATLPGFIQDGPIYAQSGGGFNLSWNSIDGGGGTFSTGSGYRLGGTIGQTDAGQQNGGGYSLKGGFWQAAATPTPTATATPIPTATSTATPTATPPSPEMEHLNFIPIVLK